MKTFRVFALAALALLTAGYVASANHSTSTVRALRSNPVPPLCPTEVCPTLQ